MPSSEVHVGRDGWLFLVGGRNRAASLYRRNPIIWWRLKRWRRLIERRAAHCSRLNIRFLQVVAPEKLTILSHYCAEWIVDPELSPAVRLGSLLAQSPARSAYLDLVRPLRSAATSADVYLRTDSHWNYQGCLSHIARFALLSGFATVTISLTDLSKSWSRRLTLETNSTRRSLRVFACTMSYRIRPATL